jgi:hypothetical protein
LSRRICFRRVDDSLLDICRQAVECLLNIDVALRRDLEEWDAKLVRQLLTPFRRYHPSVFPITLVSDQDLIYAFCSMLLNVREPSPDIYKIFSRAEVSLQDAAYC